MRNKILLVEDEEYIRDIYKDELKSCGFIVDAFETGREALKAFGENNYDLVILDIILPDINGLNILKTIKLDELKKNTPVLLLTNLDEDIIIKQGLKLGAADYLQKVLTTPDMIVDKIKFILSANES